MIDGLIGSPIAGAGEPGKSSNVPKGSYVVPFCFCYGLWVADYNIRSKKELHGVWVGA